MSLYLDTSVVLPLFAVDVHTPRVTAWLAGAGPDLRVSGWMLTEFSAVIALRQRMGQVTPAERAQTERALDTWISALPTPIALSPAQTLAARELIRQDRVALRAPDALHLAIAQQAGLGMVTLDTALGSAARDIGLNVIVP